MDVIRQTANGKVFLTYKVIGGIFDFRFFLGNRSA
jgi:alpha-glucosidase (family GH31 glycosyl hydrolase)